MLVHLVGDLREMVGKKEIEVTIPNSTIGGLIDKITQGYGENFKYEVVDRRTGDLRMIILVNNEDIRFLRGLDTLLRDGDKVVIIPPIAGG